MDHLINSTKTIQLKFEKTKAGPFHFMWFIIFISTYS